MASAPYNTDSIARKLIAIESAHAGIVRGRVNPIMLDAAASILKNMGYKKGLFISVEQFFWNCVLRSEAALMRILPSSMLAGGRDGEGLVQCWAGSGAYVGEQGLFQMGDFTSGGKDRITMILNIKPFFEELAPLLAEAKRGAVPQENKTLKVD